MLGLTIANFAKNLFSGEKKAERQARRAEKKETKAAAQKAKEAAKDAITGGGILGAKGGQMWSNFTGWISKNKEIILIVFASVTVIWVLWKFVFKKGKRRTYSRRTRAASAPRRRRSSGSVAARMARVRSFRKRKR